MTWDGVYIIASAASVAGLVLGVILGFVQWRLGRQTNQLIAAGDARTQALLERMDAHTQATLAQMHRETQATLDKIDARAEERHRWER